MKFIIQREQLLKPLYKINSILSGRPILPILNNLLIQVNQQGTLILTTTNLEMEMVEYVLLKQGYEPGVTTVSAHKFFNICRSLPEGVEISITLKNNRILLCSERSRFLLSTLPPGDFPNLSKWKIEVEFKLSQATLKLLIESTQFSMAHQDVRYYLNGMMFEITDKELRTVATDGHRLAICSIPIEQKLKLPKYSIIMPRKCVLELLRLLDKKDESLLNIQIGSSNIRVHIGNLIFTSKLIDGNFPDYSRVLPTNANKKVEANCDVLKNALNRAAIVSNDKFRGVRFYFSQAQLKIVANNQEKEESEEILDIIYSGSELEIGFNVTYILEALNALKCRNVRLLLTDSVSSIQIEDVNNQKVIYVIMPIRL